MFVSVRPTSRVRWEKKAEQRQQLQVSRGAGKMSNHYHHRHLRDHCDAFLANTPSAAVRI